LTPGRIGRPRAALARRGIPPKLMPMQDGTAASSYGRCDRRRGQANDSSADRAEQAHLTVSGTETLCRAHRFEHRIVEVDPLGTDLDGLAGLEAAVRARDRVENAGELALHNTHACISVHSCVRCTTDGQHPGPSPASLRRGRGFCPRQNAGQRPVVGARYLRARFPRDVVTSRPLTRAVLNLDSQGGGTWRRPRSPGPTR
jgi:hypothetical protein